MPRFQICRPGAQRLEKLRGGPIDDLPALKEMGCEIETFAACLGGEACRFHDTNSVHSAVIRGVSKLRGADVTLPDVRAGFSAVLAAAVADRPSVLRGIHHIERGYHRPFEQFGSLGLNIRRAEPIRRG